MHPTDKDPATLLKEISAIVLWSHVIAAGVLGYFFLTREEETAAHAARGRHAARWTWIASWPKRACR